MYRTEKEEFIIGGLSLLSNKLTQIGDGILPDITFKQWFLLMMISKMENKEKNINSIAEFVGTSRQNIKKMLTPLEIKGYVSISKSKNDSRSLKVQLTEETYKYFNDNDAVIIKEANQLFSLFKDDEINSFVTLIRKLLNGIEVYKDKENDSNENNKITNGGH